MNKRLRYFLIFTIVLAVFVSPFASGAPDGLEKVALDLGFMEYEKEPMFEILPDYNVTFIPFDGVSTGLSGLIGLLIISLLFTCSWHFSKFRRSSSKKA